MIKSIMGTFTVAFGAIVVVDSVVIIDVDDVDDVVVVVVVVDVVVVVVVVATSWPKQRGSLPTTMKKLVTVSESIPLFSFL